MLAELSALGSTLVATQSSNPRALPAEELAGSPSPTSWSRSSRIPPRRSPARASMRRVLVTGSLYLSPTLKERRLT